MDAPRRARRTPAYELTWPGKAPPHERAARPPGAPGAPAPAFYRTESFEPPAAGPPGFRGRLYRGDNLDVMEALLPELAGKIDLVYLDPPFNAGGAFTARLFPAGPAGPAAPSPAYRDAWEGGGAGYLSMLYERLRLVRELLAPSGSLILHVNWRVAHLAQVLLDELFGAGERLGPGKPGFRNEIVWGYGGGGHVRGAYRRKHDNLLWYSRSERWTFHPQYRPYTEGTRRRGLTAVKGDRYALRTEGAALESWWTGPEVGKILSPTARENRKYPTQKPEALLERILLGHSSPGDLVADFCCGSGTTPAVAARLGRRWLAADSSPLAFRIARARLSELQLRLAAEGRPCAPFDCFEPAEPEPALRGILRAAFACGPGGGCVRLLDYRPDLSHLPARTRRALPAGIEEQGLSLLEGWSVDWSCDGRLPGAECRAEDAGSSPGPAPSGRSPFRHCWRSPPAAPGACVAVESGPLPPGAGRVRVLARDRLGGAAETLLER